MVCFMTLQRYCKKFMENGKISSVGYASPRVVFTKEQKLLVSYILNAAKIYHGLTPKEIRKLAYEYESANEIGCPDTWSANGIAGVDWFSKFMKRNRSLSIRTPEATSLNRATSFNLTNVNKFFDNLTQVIDTHKFEAHDIYNCDETGVTTLQRPDRIVTEKGVKQVGVLPSAERRTLVTMCLAVNTSGNSIPPMLVFPRVNYREHFVINRPTGSCGSANPSGWMKEADFLIFLQHFVKHTRCSQQHLVLLLLDFFLTDEKFVGQVLDHWTKVDIWPNLCHGGGETSGYTSQDDVMEKGHTGLGGKLDRINITSGSCRTGLVQRIFICLV
ncbi:PREDICTED: uncharacterized protein LOC106817562 isoform X2 [Priapulus caudatus]|uniref:Uncharacterized protein LOC106817562 isoform X2 n=1 Tax=Priapulus caudatus TaxID=37621 RepID=A0ABM1EZV2_PRICU|nr:PREDICTED: uncharacterized protein LOC106817562 isoform X2 [Priapulus caudatus]